MKDKIYGTTLFINQTEIDTIYGTFKVHTFQDVITKGYVIALSYGDIHNDILYTRIHSSCVTSETLQSLDCDCVEQLNGAFKKIKEKGHGILFYLIQEGRGCGYIGKSRACMHCQYTDDKMTTFEAYNMLGMKNDYRDYTSISDICNILNINPKFVLLTNNPDKIKGMKELGLNLYKTESIEICPNPYNHSYLISKEKTGHMIYSSKTKVKNYDLPYQKVEPFVPHHLEHSKRFVFISSYYIPVRPTDNKILMENKLYIDNLDLLKNIPYEKVPNDKIILHLSTEDLDRLPSHLITQPYWMKVFVYYDIASNLDYVVLQYGDISNSDSAIVRIHSESIINRFPLKNRKYVDLYNDSIQMILRHGCGMIVLFYNDGKGSGFGNYVLQQSYPNNEIGIPNDKRDYNAASQLIKHHVQDVPIILLYTCNSSRETSKLEIQKNDIKIKKMINIDKNEIFGNDSLSLRNNKCMNISELFNQIQLQNLDENYFLCNNKDSNKKHNIIVSGIGTSEAHAKYLVYLFSKGNELFNIKFKSILELRNYKKEEQNESIDHLILISQGLSTNVIDLFNLVDYKNITLFTSVTINNSNPVKKNVIDNLLKNKSTIINYPLENEYDTLIRITGPIAGYLAIWKYHKYICQKIGKDKDYSLKLNIPKIDNLYINHPDEDFVKNLTDNNKLCLIFPEPVYSFRHNIVNKFIEGIFIDPLSTNYLDFVHGKYQNIEHTYHVHQQKYSIILFKNSSNVLFIEKICELLKDYPIWIIDSCVNENEYLEIVEYELIINKFIIQMIEKYNIDQTNWYGKDKQHILYDL